jgi:hypothetical protein
MGHLRARRRGLGAGAAGFARRDLQGGKYLVVQTLIQLLIQLSS